MSGEQNRAAELHAVLAQARAVRPGEHVLIVVARVEGHEVDTYLAARVGRGETTFASDLAQTTHALSQVASQWATEMATGLAKYHRGLS